MRNIVHMDLVVAGMALFCFASFGWGMGWHFERVRPARWSVVATGLAAAVFACLQMTALLSRPISLPRLAAALYCSSAALFWWAVWATWRRGFGACFSGISSGEVVTHGPYRWVRHPFYSAYQLCWIGGAVAAAWWPAALPVAAMGWLYRRAALGEERSLGERHGGAYLAYMRRTGRFWPRVPFLSRKEHQ